MRDAKGAVGEDLPAFGIIQMKLRIVLALTLSFGFSPVSEAASVEDLSWLSGCWASVGAEAGSGEQWMAPAGGTLLGINRSVAGSKTVAHEFMQIRETERGEIEFIA